MYYISIRNKKNNKINILLKRIKMGIIKTAFTWTGPLLGIVACVVALAIGAASWNWFRTSEPKTTRMKQLEWANAGMTLAMIVVLLLIGCSFLGSILLND